MAAATRSEKPHPALAEKFHWVNDYVMKYHCDKPRPDMEYSFELGYYIFITDNLNYKIELATDDAIFFTAYDDNNIIFFQFYMPPRREQFWALMRILDIK